MPKMKLAALLGAAATTAGLALAFTPAANAEPLPTCREIIGTAIEHNQAAIDANLADETDAALDANQAAQSDELSAIVLCLTQPLSTTLSLVAATLNNASAMTANDRGPSGAPAALTAEYKVEASLKRALETVR